MTTKKSNLFLNINRNPKSPDFGDRDRNPTNRAIKIFAAVIILAALIAGGYFGYKRYTASKTAAAEATPLQTAKAITGDLVLYANGTGTVATAAESSIGFNTSGQVSEIKVEIGDQVSAGDVLAQLDDTDAKLQRSEAQEAMDALTSAAAIATAEQELAAAQSNFVTVKAALGYVISPEVLYWEEKVAEREQTLADAQSAYQMETSDATKQKVTDAESSLQYAQDSLAYFQTVYRKDYIPATFKQYRTFYFRGRKITEPVQTEDKHGKKHNVIIPPTDAEIAIARANYELAKASIAEAQMYLDILNGSEIPEGATGAKLVTYIQTKHALEKTEYNLNATRLDAPVSGTVTALDMSVGDLVGSDAVITISNLDQPYSLEAYLDAEDWGQVRAGYEVEVMFDILPEQIFTGVVTSVDPTLDTTSSNKALIHINAILNDSIAYDLPAGSAASVDVVGGRAENAVLVPIEALHEIDDGKYTLFVMENGKLRLRVVQVGLQDLTKAEIISGLSAGDIVTTGVVETK